jgi:UrcA family protein
MKMNRTLIASALLMVASAASAANAIVITGDNPPTATISYNDLDLHSLKARTRLQGRIRMAATRICVTGAADPAPMLPMSPDQQCYQTALASGLSQLKQIAGE